MAGWIKLYRDIQEHWIWKSDHRLKWWLDILLTVNHVDSKVLIKGNLIECKRGQSVMSLETWGKRWGVTKKAVRDFFILLQNDSMLLLENIKVTTRITVCNYDNYQTLLHAEETPRKRKRNGQETVRVPKQEGEEGIKNEKNIIPPPINLIITYCKERNNLIDPNYFFDYNEARGWKINGKPMKDWQATIRYWEKNNNSKNGINKQNDQRSVKRINSEWNRAT